MIEIIPIESIGPLHQSKNVGSNEGTGFTTFLQDALNNLEQIQAEGNQASQALITGAVEDLHTPIIALEKANISLSLAVTVRNKVINAYQEIMRMQI